ncbi:hypothetical protein DPEC_G00063230 [Dallia pectoralis]|uniref:Uncharacterized protein n=1 Tax=Dallia pectoralis TaxID=75939 RepID=A0ACC2H7M9_DALPE|nr:hypothetical protein DPEC_G00063230 [Dallia pectoralis]
MWLICSIILSSAIGVSDEQTIEANQHEMYTHVGSNIHLSCNYSALNPQDSLLWYKQSPGSAPQYLLLIQSYSGKVTNAESLDSRFLGKRNEEKTRVDLVISTAEVTDSALYYCALRPTVTGNPETLYKNLTSPDISTLDPPVS